MLHIVGGTYHEICHEPEWDELFGSGGRAAVALAEFGEKIKLTTYIGDVEKSTLDVMASTFGFLVDHAVIPQTISFTYHHCLSEPVIRPAISAIKQSPLLEVDDDIILRFGFLEGDSVVRGRKVVYDPQNTYSPSLFTENGSTATSLGIVANANECRRMLKAEPSSSLEDLGKELLTKEGAEVVVIKNGSSGAIVVTKTEVKIIPAFQTHKVWSIGSGDIFAAIFCYFWACKNLSPFDSALYASKATAYYCNTKSLPIPTDFKESSNFQPIDHTKSFSLQSKQVYLAGPFFTMAERWIINQSRQHLLNEGFKVFSPFHDVGYGSALQVAPADIKALEESDLIFAILDGLDAGTLFEIGYAKALNKPIVVFVQNENDEDLKMIAGTGCEIVNDFVSAIYRTVWTATKL